MSDIDALSDREALAAVRALVLQWIDARGREPLVAWQAITQAAGDAGLAAPLVSTREDDADAAAICRRILKAVADGNSPDERRWAIGAVAAARQPKAQVFDPVSLTIIGITAIGLVLAARVKRIGNVEFYEGLPEGTDKLVGTAVKAMSGIPPGTGG